MNPKPPSNPETVPLDFSGKTDPAIVAQFLSDLVRAMSFSGNIRRRAIQAGFAGSPEEMYRRFNAPGHPVRDGMILFGHNLLPSDGPDEGGEDIAHLLVVLDTRIQRIASQASHLEDGAVSDVVRNIAGTLEIMLDVIGAIEQKMKK